VWFAEAHELGRSEDLELVTLAAALAHRADLPTNCFMTVNLEPESLLSPRIRSVLAAQGNLGGIVVEITEHRRLDIEALEGPLNWLRGAGALIAVDDAGAGYAGLQAILDLRPSILKLDRSLVEGIDAWVLAEGVETLEEATRLIDLGVPLAQGYLFARPAPPWAAMDTSVEQSLASFSGAAGDNLFRLIDPVAAARFDQCDLSRLSFGAAGWIPVVDETRRPRGLFTPDSALTGELIAPMVANVRSSPTEVAHRLSTATVDPAAPVIVTDNAGRYLGVVTLRRLLGDLARTIED